MAQMEPPPTSDNDAANYPRNVADRTLCPYALDAIRYHLDSQASRLFTDEAEAALDTLTLANGAQGMLNVISSRCLALYILSDFWPSRVSNVEHLKRHLRISPSRDPSSSLCEFL